MNKNFDIFKVIDSRVKNYNCSLDCNGMCCKVRPVDFSQDEYSKMLSQVDSQSKEILLTQTEDDDPVLKIKSLNIPIEKFPREFAEQMSKKKARQFKTAICPMLENDKCRIYEFRPGTCRYYPFNYDNLYSDGVIKIEPCLMGLDIIFDYLAMTINSGFYYNDPLSKKNYIEETLRLSLVLYNDRIYPERRTGDATFGIKDIKMLLQFKHYLKNYSYKKRLYERNVMYDFVKTHSSKQVNNITISEFITKFQSS